MDNHLKQRLVGALILVALAVIFWPIIFVGPSDTGSLAGDAEIEVSVAEAPPVDLSPLPEPDDLGLRVPREAQATELPPEQPVDALGVSEAEPPELPQRSEVVVPATAEEVRDTLEKPEIDEDGLPIAFSLQVATMSREEGAERLRSELIEAGYKGYLTRLRSGDKTLYRVMVGPRFRKDDLQAVKQAVDATWSVDSIIVRYLP